LDFFRIRCGLAIDSTPDRVEIPFNVLANHLVYPFTREMGSGQHAWYA
jgi:hypothetical protein